MYFSPLDLRSVISLVQWKRSDDVVVVATCLEQYDEGGMLRLRIDGIRADDDTFVSWPRVMLEIDGNDMMKFDKSELKVADSCTEVELTLKHSGKLPATAMGHNWVLTKTGDLTAVANAGMTAKDSDYDPVRQAAKVLNLNLEEQVKGK